MVFLSWLWRIVHGHVVLLESYTAHGKVKKNPPIASPLLVPKPYHCCTLLPSSPKHTSISSRVDLPHVIITITGTIRLNSIHTQLLLSFRMTKPYLFLRGFIIYYLFILLTSINENKCAPSPWVELVFLPWKEDVLLQYSDEIITKSISWAQAGNFARGLELLVQFQIGLGFRVIRGFLSCGFFRWVLLVAFS